MIALLTFWRTHRALIALLLVAALAATAYAFWKKAEADRNSLIRAADNICAATGPDWPFRPEGVEKRQWGVTCLERVRHLARFERDTVAGSLDVALEHIERQQGREAADAALARIYSQRAALALENMEAADAAVQDDVVGPGWAAGVNDLGGLRR